MLQLWFFPWQAVVPARRRKVLLIPLRLAVSDLQPGGAAAYGQAVQNAIQLAVDEINEAGGINGYKLELNFQDDEHDAEKSVNAYNTIKDWGAQLLIGCVTSTPCIAVEEKTKEDNMFQLTPSGTAVACTQYDNAFRVCFSDPAQGTASAQYVGEHNPGKQGGCYL